MDGSYVRCFLVFFFQAEDGIRDTSVTGVQTCALPICRTDGSVDSHNARHVVDRQSHYSADIERQIIRQRDRKSVV